MTGVQTCALPIYMKVRVTQVSNQGKMSASVEELTVKVIETITMSCFVTGKVKQRTVLLWRKRKCSEM